LRLLARRGFLVPVKENGKISGWTRSGSWPPPAEFFQSGPVGFAYFVSSWFRYYLQQWIEKRLSELESKEGVYSYGLRSGTLSFHNLRAGNIDGTFIPDGSEEVVQHRANSSMHFLADNERPLHTTKLNREWD